MCEMYMFRNGDKGWGGVGGGGVCVTVKCPKVCARFYTMTFESYRANTRMHAR